MLAGTSLKVSLTAIADPELLQSRAEILGLDVRVKTVTANDIDEPAPPGTLHVLPVSLKTSVQPGRLDPGNATYVLDTLDQAIDGCLAQRFDAMVTGPVSKSVINDAGIAFSGHTEYLAGKCAAPLPVMMLANDAVRVALVTTHLPLDAVAAAITGERLEQVLTILHHDLVNRFAIKTPRIAVCGLNPHAGENGLFSHGEEAEIIQPAIDRLPTKPPVSADLLAGDLALLRQLVDRRLRQLQVRDEVVDREDRARRSGGIAGTLRGRRAGVRLPASGGHCSH